MSLWIKTAYSMEAFPALNNAMQCDVCIIGGGLSGIMNAYLLAQEGKDVILIEKDRILGGATGHSTGKLTVQHDLIYRDLIQKFGIEAARLYFDVNEAAVQFGKGFASKDEIQTANSVLYAQTELGHQLLKEEAEAYRTVGIGHELGKDNELPLKMRATLKINNEAQIHPVRFGQTLAQMAIKAGTRIFEKSRIATIATNEQQLVLTNGVTVDFSELILSTHYPIESLTGAQILKLSVDRSYLVAAKSHMPLQNQYIAVDQPKRSIRTAKIDGENYFLLGGKSHTAGTKKHTSQFYEALYHEVKEDFLLTSLETGWSAQDPSTPDLLPYAGQITKSLPHLFISTGNRKWGLSNSIASAQIITDAIVGRRNKAIDLYSPSRTKFGALALQSLKLAGLVAKEFPLGHLTRTNAPICTHLGCRTRWNDADETWDCPCHGSRFRKDGSVLEGPATKPLKL